MLYFVIIAIFFALVFDFLNGFHDAANSIATVVSTRVLSPKLAVAWAAFFNFIAAFGFGTQVAHTIGSGLIDISTVDNYVIIAGLLGAIFWNLLTWWLGLPISSSHALIGGYAGAAVAKAGFSILLLPGWVKVLSFIVISPLLGLLLGFLFMIAVFWLFRKKSATRMDQIFRRLQLVSAASYSLAHGTNDAQKTMGIIAGVLFTAGYLQTYDIPFYVVLMCHAAIALGTLLGGWRIVKTMGTKITKLQPVGGFCAETAGAITIIGSSLAGIPVSTTHTITGAIMGVGSARRPKSVRWGVARSIVWAWILTIPVAASVSALFYWILTLIF
ncbi:MAG: inorganic phosphate transporter [Caldiserica bacterium]|jgi:PiT family inorganic phosphate transporter|nr:inorganic phosphate transporter [Caldisericota bacterium]MDH7562220.1 inorganic phosphate transporter [Caldisericota bacterium]